MRYSGTIEYAVNKTLKSTILKQERQVILFESSTLDATNS